MKVLLTWFATKDEVRRYGAVLPKGSTVLTPKPRDVISRYEVAYDDVAHLVPEADVIVGWVIPAGIWDLARKVKALIWLHSGCDELDFALLKRRGIKVANVRNANAISVAEHAMALMLGLAKRLIHKHNAVLKAHWEPPGGAPEHHAVFLHEKTLAVIGLGQIGSGIAKRAKSFDMRVIATRRHPERGGAGVVDAIYGPKDLHKVLGQADFTILATPLTKETKGFIDAKAIKAMKPGIFLINIARGNIIEEKPLYDALKSWRLAGFATDVWWTYENAIPATYHFPIPSRTGLQHLPNVMCTGNQAGSGVWEVKDDVVPRYAIESLAAYAQGKPMPRSVDLDLGY